MAHVHKFTSAFHLDGCHSYTTSGTCSCGATVTVSHERDPTADPYTMVWMEPQFREVNRDAKGRFIKPRFEEVVCARCEELKAGAKTRHDLVIVAKGGKVLREEHEEREQQAFDDNDEEEEDGEDS